MKTKKQMIAEQFMLDSVSGYDDVFTLLHNTKTFAVNMEGYSKLLISSSYDKLSKGAEGYIRNYN